MREQEIKLQAYRECLHICEANGGGDAADEIRQLIKAAELGKIEA
jgi:hypothetical protein